MSNIYCPECHTDTHLGVVRHENITVNPDCNKDKHPINLPLGIGATIKCFKCNIEFEAVVILEFENNPF